MIWQSLGRHFDLAGVPPMLQELTPPCEGTHMYTKHHHWTIVPLRTPFSTGSWLPHLCNLSDNRTFTSGMPPQPSHIFVLQ